MAIQFFHAMLAQDGGEMCMYYIYSKFFQCPPKLTHRLCAVYLILYRWLYR